MTKLYQIRQKLLNKAALIEKVNAWKKEGLKVIFTNGCFDIIHPGHIDYLAKAASLGDKFIIGVNTDASVRILKGPSRPIQNQDARALILAALCFTSAIVLFDEQTPKELISAILPDILVKGADYSISEVVGADVVVKNGGSVVLLPYLTGYSTSAIEKKIKSANSTE
jgi:D-glycero-beta-D-manno-heptose 1-phosphate adenylyltransferase